MVDNFKVKKIVDGQNTNIVVEHTSKTKGTSILVADGNIFISNIINVFPNVKSAEEVERELLESLLVHNTEW